MSEMYEPTYVSEVGNKKDLEYQLKIIKDKEEIDNEIKNTKCPLCGGDFEYKINSGGDWGSVPAVGTIKCNKCELINYKIVYNSTETYNWIHDGTSEVEMLKKLWNRIRNYVKK